MSDARFSAFGVMHEFSKAQKRDAKGRFARSDSGKKHWTDEFAELQEPKNPKRLTDDEYEMESESNAVDMKNLFHSEGDDKSWNIWKDQLILGAQFAAEHGESELIDDIFDALYTSEQGHKRLLAAKRKKP